MPTTPDVPAAAREGEYVVVARRYRPTSFDELIGQGHVAQALRGAIETHRVGHAYLFTGARGVGKTSTARILAKALNCEQGPTATPCNTCDICQSVASGDDVDVLEIDGASNRGIDEIRQLRQNAGVRPSRARFKIYIIDEVHMLTKEAFNALLKTLEEPPEHVKFMFATTEPNKIPITILSRCQRFDFAGIAAGEIETRLAEIAQAEGVEVESEALEILARRAAGSMRDSQSLLEQLLSLGIATVTAADVHAMLGTAPSARLAQMVEALAGRDAGSALAELDAAVSEGVEPAQLLDQLLGVYRDIMAAAVGCQSDQFAHTSRSEAEQVQRLAEQVGLETILAAMQILEQATARLRSSTHGRTLAEMALVRIARLEDLDALPALLEAVRSGAPLPASSGPAAAPASKKKIVADNDRSDHAPARRNAADVDPPPAALRGEPTAPAHRVDGADAAPPAPAASQGAQPKLTDQSVVSVWRNVLDGLTELVADQAALSDHVALAGPGRLVVRFPAKYTSCRQFCERTEQKSILEQALTRAAGEHVSLEFVTEESGEAAPVARQPRSASRRQRSAEVVGQPLVQRAMELFEVDEPRVDLPEEPQ